MKKFFNFIFAAAAVVGMVVFSPFIELAGYIMSKFKKEDTSNLKKEDTSNFKEED